MMSLKAILSGGTLLLVAVIVFFSRTQLEHAFELLSSVNIFILLLLIPMQILVYYAGGEMMFSYLRAKKSIDSISKPELVKLSLELNFVNHILPSGGVSGASYMNWRLSQFGVPKSRATIAQFVRYTMGFCAFIALLLVAVFVVTIDGNINRIIILLSTILVGAMIGMIVGLVFLLGSYSRVVAFSFYFTRCFNGIIKLITLNRKRNSLKVDTAINYFSEMHYDFESLLADKRILIKPFLWGIVFTLADVMLFYITFLALGEVINPAPLLIAYGVASISGVFVLTPGGVGVYEAVMIAILAIAGLSQSTVIAGVVLTRTVLLLGTIIFGYIFYQRGLNKYGKDKHTTSL